MPFFGSDWRSPGDKWIRTDSGWRPRSDIHKALSAQIVNHFRHFTSKSTSNPRSRTSPTGKTSPDHVCEASRKWRWDSFFLFFLQESGRPCHISSQLLVLLKPYTSTLPHVPNLELIARWVMNLVEKINEQGAILMHTLSSVPRQQKHWQCLEAVQAAVERARMT